MSDPDSIAVKALLPERLSVEEPKASSATGVSDIPSENDTTQGIYETEENTGSLSDGETSEIPGEDTVVDALTGSEISTGNEIITPVSRNSEPIVKISEDKSLDSIKEESTSVNENNGIMFPGVESKEELQNSLQTAVSAIEPGAPLRDGGGFGISWILGALFLLALIIALRFRDNVKYVIAIVHDLTTTKVRHNAFDDTVKETSLLVLLNILWCAGAGITFYEVFSQSPAALTGISGTEGMLYGMAIAGSYSVLLYFCYLAVGWIFSDKGHAVLWVKGYAASQALMSPAFFLTALIAISWPEEWEAIGMVAMGVFILGKLLFILKGYKIFFNQISSWVLFLCYLCSLEIVPLIMCYRCARLLI